MTIRVGITERHGMADETVWKPPHGIEFSFPQPTGKKPRWMRSPIRGYLNRYSDKQECDLFEAILSPILTPHPWIGSLDSYSAAIAFHFLGLPLPITVRSTYVNRLFGQDNCRQILFWSEAARKSLVEYGGVTDPRILDKAIVVYPAIREVPNDEIQYSDNQVQLLFSGDFFRKGGANVVDTFEVLQKQFPGIKLRVCCDATTDFISDNHSLKLKYLEKIRSNDGIQFGRVTRQVMIEEILPETDIYLLPTYNEAFGFAILEAMAFGIPVISTNQYAIPEIIEHENDGFLIDISGYNTQKMFRGYRVDEIPRDFHDHINEQLVRYLTRLIESSALRKSIGMRASRTVRSRFGFQARNETMSAVYRNAVS